MGRVGYRVGRPALRRAGESLERGFFHAAPNIDHSQDFVQRDICEWLRWLQAEVGYDGWRLDYVRGFSGTHVKKYLEATDVHFAVGEYWDTLSYDYDQPQYNQDPHRQRIVKWIDDAGGLAGAFDVTTKGILHAVFESRSTGASRTATGPPGCSGGRRRAARRVHREPRHGEHAGALEVPGGREPLATCTSSRTRRRRRCSGTTCSSGTTRRSASASSSSSSSGRRWACTADRGVKILRAEQSVSAAQIDDALVMKIGTGEYSPSAAEWEYHTHGISWCLWRRRGSAQA